MAFNIFNLLILLAAFVNRCRRVFRTQVTKRVTEYYIQVIERRILDVTVVRKDGECRRGLVPGIWLTINSIAKHHDFNPDGADDYMRIKFMQGSDTRYLIVTTLDTQSGDVYFEIPAVSKIPATEFRTPKNLEIVGADENDVDLIPVEGYMVSDSHFGINSGDFRYKHIDGLFQSGGSDESETKNMMTDSDEVVAVTPETPVSLSHLSSY